MILTCEQRSIVIIVENDSWRCAIAIYFVVFTVGFQHSTCQSHFCDQLTQPYDVCSCVSCSHILIVCAAKPDVVVLLAIP